MRSHESPVRDPPFQSRRPRQFLPALSRHEIIPCLIVSHYAGSFLSHSRSSSHGGERETEGSAFKVPFLPRKELQVLSSPANRTIAGKGQLWRRDGRPLRRIKMGTVLMIVLVLALIGAIPTWGYSSGWGYGPSGGIGFLLLIVIILAMLGHI